VLDPETLEQLRRYLQQRLAAGEKERLRVPAAGPHEPRRGPEAGTADIRRVPAAGIEPSETGGSSTRPKRGAMAAATLAPETGESPDSLQCIAAEVAVCQRCRLHEKRTHAVPGVGPENAAVVFIGEGPGAEEDLQGKPFVGPAGQLLTKIIESVALRREDVFITNIVKCRPPGNRDPQPDEVAACEPYLKRQLAILQPKVICALGRHAGSWLAGAPESMAALRTGERRYQGIRVFPTYHPAALLRNPQWKRPVWEDIQKVRAEYDRLSSES
jgi:DNA polymerase